MGQGDDIQKQQRRRPFVHLSLTLARASWHKTGFLVFLYLALVVFRLVFMTVSICGAGTSAEITQSPRGYLLSMELSQAGGESGVLSTVKMLPVVFSHEFFPKARTAEPRTGTTQLSCRVGMDRRGVA